MNKKAHWKYGNFHENIEIFINIEKKKLKPQLVFSYFFITENLRIFKKLVKMIKSFKS